MYLKPLTVIDALLADHRKFLVECHKHNKFIYSGSQSPRLGEAIVADIGIDEARAIVKKDPLFIAGAADYQFVEFTPGRSNEGLFWQDKGPTYIFD
jgi:uncharacterized protein YciI